MNTATQQPLFSIDQMCIDAEKRVQRFINQCAGQHLRAMKRPHAHRQSRDFGVININLKAMQP